MGNSFFFSKQTIPDDNANVPNRTGGYRPSQPSQKYPFAPNQPQRVDNMNQPWYGSNQRGWGAGPDTIQDQSAQDLTGSKLTNFWDTLNKFFGGEGPKRNLQSPDSRNKNVSLVSNPSAVGAQNRGFLRQLRSGWGNIYE